MIYLKMFKNRVVNFIKSLFKTYSLVRLANHRSFITDGEILDETLDYLGCRQIKSVKRINVFKMWIWVYATKI